MHFRRLGALQDALDENLMNKVSARHLLKSRPHPPPSRRGLLGLAPHAFSRRQLAPRGTLRCVTVRTAIATEDGWSKRVLIVAREWTAVEPIKEALKGTTIHIAHVANSMSEAITFLEQTEVDVVVAHLRLPDSEGLEVAREIHDRWPTPRILVCGPGDMELMRLSLLAGVKDYVAEGIGHEVEETVMAIQTAVVQD